MKDLALGLALLALVFAGYEIQLLADRLDRAETATTELTVLMKERDMRQLDLMQRQAEITSEAIGELFDYH